MRKSRRSKPSQVKVLPAARPYRATGLLVVLFLPIGAVLFVLACVDYAKSKGLHPAMGLLGLGSIFGLIVLSVWPDRYKFDKEATRELKKVAKR